MKSEVSEFQEAHCQGSRHTILCRADSTLLAALRLPQMAAAPTPKKEEERSSMHARHHSRLHGTTAGSPHPPGQL